MGIDARAPAIRSGCKNFLMPGFDLFAHLLGSRHRALRDLQQRYRSLVLACVHRELDSQVEGLTARGRRAVADIKGCGGLRVNPEFRRGAGIVALHTLLRDVS
jgi:hypothetical protein